MLLLNPIARVALAGSMAPAIASGVEALLTRDIVIYDEWCAARGLAKIARDTFLGAHQILGLAVDR